MSDRMKGCWVAFEEDMKDEDAEEIMQVIRHIRGIQAVEGQVTDSDDWMVRQHVKADMKDKFMNLFRDF